MRTRPARVLAREGLVEAPQVALEARGRERVDHVALAAGCRALHLLHRTLRDRAVHAPAAGRLPVEPAVRSHPARQVQALPALRHGDDVPRRAGRQRLVERAVPDLAPSELEARRRKGVAHPRPSEGPAGSSREVDPERQAPALGERVPEHLHEARREERDLLVLPALDSVDRADLDAAEAGRAEELELAGEVLLVDRGAEPPPARPRAVLGGRNGPRRRGRRGLGGRQRGRKGESPREQDRSSHRCGRQSVRRPIAASRAATASFTSSAFSATFCAVKPYFSITTLTGAEAPKRPATPTTFPNGPT